MSIYKNLTIKRRLFCKKAPKFNIQGHTHNYCNL
jgi:hypothetical protein